MPSFNYEFPYASKKLPIFADNVVASSQHLAATAGLRMLAKGGNAVDAALAAAIAITITEPTMNGIGSDAFCILWDGTKLVGLNASGHSPALMTPDKYAGLAAMPSVGWATRVSRIRSSCAARACSSNATGGCIRSAHSWPSLR